MPSSYTSSLRLTLPVQGELAGSWGNTVNSGITQLLDTAVAGTASITMTAANYTLTNNNGATDEARSMFLVLGGTPGASYQVICPAVSKLYFVTNNTGFAQTVKTASGSGISVPNGARMTLRCDGTDVVVAQNYFASITLGAALPVASGGTGLTSFTSGGVVYASSSSALATGSALVFDGTNLGIGTSSPAFKLDVQGASGLGIRIFETSTGNNNRLQITQSGIDSIYNNTFSTGNGTHAWQIGNAEQMRLDSSGNLGIGTSSPAQRLDVVGAQNSVQARFGNVTGRGLEIGTALVSGTNDAGSVLNAKGAASGTLIFQTDSTERARITSGGDLLVGTTSNPNNYKTHIVTSASSIALGIFANNATTPSGINVYYGAAAPNNSNANTSYLYCNDTSTVRIQLSSNGGIQNYQANDINLSDRREKTNFAPAKSYLDTICAIPVQTFNYIDQSEDDPGLTLGVVAQDVQAVAPELVMESNWGTADEPKQRLSIYQTDLQYALMKCIQEQQALITDLRARVAALEQA